MQETFLEKNTLNHQCWETSREYNQVNGPTAFSSPGEFSGYLCVQMDLVLSSGVQGCLHFPWHS